jgi:hypothetical protein
LEETLFGPAAPLRKAFLPGDGSTQGEQQTGTLDEKMRRRSIYFFVKRSQLTPMLALFDAPDTLQDIALRPSTMVAPQALLMMNSPIVREYAEGLAQRVAKTAGSDDAAAKVRRAYAIALGRAPAADEEADALAFLGEQTKAYEAEKRENPASVALADFCQTLLSLNEFVFVD